MNDQTTLVNGSTRLYGIVGHPIVQVRSPEVMTTWLRSAGRNAVLLPMHVIPDLFDTTLAGLMQMANLDGLMFTVPYKIKATALASRLMPEAQRVGGVNALRRERDGSWTGEIFDGIGLVHALAAQDFDVAGSRAKILGTGGAGSAVAMALANAGASAIELSDVDAARVSGLADQVRSYFPACSVTISESPADVRDITLLINCTPIGMQPGDGMPAKFDRFPSQLMVVDVIMKPAVTPLAEHARQCGCPVMNGIPMLDHQTQAVMAFFSETAR